MIVEIEYGWAIDMGGCNSCNVQVAPLRVTRIRLNNVEVRVCNKCKDKLKKLLK